MIKVLLKRPGKTIEAINVKNVLEIYDLVAFNGTVEFITFNNKYNIGIYINDEGYLSGMSANFTFNGHIIYGPAVFVGLDDDGAPKRINKLQEKIIDDYLNRNSIAG